MVVHRNTLPIAVMRYDSGGFVVKPFGSPAGAGLSMCQP